MDSLARKAARRLGVESFDAPVGGPSVVYLHTAIDIAEEYELALASMREALIEALSMLQHSFTPKAKCGQKGTRCAACLLVARAAEVLKGGE